MSTYARPRWIASVVLVCAALALTSCASSTPKAAPAAGGATLVGKARSVSLGSLTPQQIGAAQTAFGLDLLAERCAAQPNANDVLSPASAAIALSMLDAGAGAGTGAALSKLLHIPAWSPDVVAALHGQHASLTALKQLQVSNRLYSQLGIKPQQKVLDDLATAFGAGLQTLDFAGHAAAATDTINSRVDADTHGLIPKLFDTPLDANTTTVLTNALYLDAKWAAPFHTAGAADFHTAAGKTVSAPMISSDANFGQLRDAGGWQSVTLPYSGGKLEAVVLLPDKSTSCAAPTAAQLKALTSGNAGEAEIQMPKLKLSQTAQLADNLAKLGLPLGGDYSGFGTTGDISQIVQKTVMQVDERGTKAAAATGIAVATSLGPTVTVGRPYLLLVRDTATATPLFLARISDPTATG